VRVLVTGGRGYNDQEHVFAVLDHYHAQVPFTCLIEGEADGLDTLAKRWAQSRGVPVDPYPADWTDFITEPVVLRYRRDGTAYNAAAGGIRNGVMLERGKPEICLSFPGGSGTVDMTKRAMRALGRDHVLMIPGRT
jgi:hypothetical protein